MLADSFWHVKFSEFKWYLLLNSLQFCSTLCPNLPLTQILICRSKNIRLESIKNTILRQTGRDNTTLSTHMQSLNFTPDELTEALTTFQNQQNKSIIDESFHFVRSYYPVCKYYFCSLICMSLYLLAFRSNSKKHGSRRLERRKHDELIFHDRPNN